MNQINISDILIHILTFVIAIAAWLISYTQLKRTRRQNNEDIIFNQKLESYRLLIKISHKFLESSHSILDELPDYKGTKEGWQKEKMPSLFRLHYPKIKEIENLIKEYSIILPENFIEEFDNFILRCTRFLVEHYHFDNGHSIDNYDKLIDIHYKLINLSRQDLHIDVLNKKLNYRLQDK